MLICTSNIQDDDSMTMC